MATERELELIDDLLSQKLEGQERVDFEKMLESDPTLKAEFQIQQQLIEGIKAARKAALKSFLDNVPVPTAPSINYGKIALWAISVGLIGFTIFFLWNNEPEVAKHPNTGITMDNTITPENDKAVSETVKDPATSGKNDDEVTAITPKNPVEKTESGTKDHEPASLSTTESIPATDPIRPFDPTQDEGGVNTNTGMGNEISPVAGGSIKEHESIHPTIKEDSKYKFHYQFIAGKLVLLGKFTDNYTILEYMKDGKHFLHYNGKFYSLDRTKTKPTPLIALVDQDIIRQLEKKQLKSN